MTDLGLKWGAASHTGRVRAQNEDRYWVDDEHGAFLVVDGMGGQAAGERAAEIAVAAIREGILRGKPGPASVRVRNAITSANRMIFEEAQRNASETGMGCVLTLALIEGSQLTIGHVGDSRLYLLDGSSIRKITRDHSPVGESEDAGELTEGEAMTHPQRHEVFRDVGSRPRLATDEDFIEVRECEINPGTAVLLCSDGLSDHLSSSVIRGIAEGYSGDTGEVARNLVDAANRAGGRDNITAVFIAGREFRAKGAITRPRFVATRELRGRRSIWTGRAAFLSYGLLLGMVVWAVLRLRG